MASASYHIAIVGGGFSGLMTAAHLVRHAAPHTRIAILDPAPSPGLGLAYATRDRRHLLNVRADRMGAWAGEPPHFWRWLEGRGEGWQPGDFVPRAVFGEYVEEIAAGTFALAAQRSITLHHLTASVISCTPGEAGYRLGTEDGGACMARTVLLASGNPMPTPAKLLRGLEHLPPDALLPSAWDASALEAAKASLPTDGTLFILGMGLTMVDTVLTLAGSGYTGTMVALSRHGHLPLPHAPHGPAATHPAEALLQAKPTVRGWVVLLRDAVRQAEAAGGDWRQVIDALRPHTTTLWQRLPDAEKRRFFRHAFALWNIHRHRMAPQVLDQITALQKEGRLRLVKGRLRDVGAQSGRIAVRWRARGGEEQSLRADRLILCAGPGYDFARGGSPLYTQMLRDGLLHPHPSGMGVQVAAEQTGLHLIGTPRIGEALETTAVPELREQAAQAAEALLASITAA